jgi:hypothetical protein
MNYSIIFVPGLKGTKLINKCTKKVIWPPPRSEFIKNFLLPNKCKELSDEIVQQLITNNVEALEIIKNIGSIKDIYESFIKIMQQMYGASFLTFAYDWRQSMSRSAFQLKEFIQSQVPSGHVIVLIGHSFGGLVARYLLENGNLVKSIENDYKFSLLITLGTPQSGSLSAFAALLGLTCTSLTNKQQTHLLCSSFDSIYELIPFVNLNNALEIRYKLSTTSKGKYKRKNLSNQNDPLYIFKLIKFRYLHKFPHFNYDKLMNAYKTITDGLNLKNKPKNCKYILLNANGSHSMEYIEFNLFHLKKSKLYYAQNTGDGVVGLMAPTKLDTKFIFDAVASIHSEMCSQSHVIELIRREINSLNLINDNVFWRNKDENFRSLLVNGNAPVNLSYFDIFHLNRQLLSRKYYKVSILGNKSTSARIEMTHEDIVNNDSILITIRLMENSTSYDMIYVNGEFKLPRQEKYPFVYNGEPISYYSISIVKAAYYIISHLNVKDIQSRDIKIISHIPDEVN